MNKREKVVTFLKKISSKISFVPKGNEVVDNNLYRILFVANSNIPTLQMYFLKPLNAYSKRDSCIYSLITEHDLKNAFGKKLRTEEAESFFIEKASQFLPSIIVFCRYSGPHANSLLQYAKKNNIPTIFYIDDDLLNVPLTLGPKKYEFHNHPLRLEALRCLLNGTDLVYCANARLIDRLKDLGINNEFYAGAICGYGKVYNLPQIASPRKIGYMGFDHAHDFEIVLPAIVKILKEYPDVTFELFGAIPKPEILDQFDKRVNVISPIPDYEEFIKRFSGLGWGIAICPLVETSFNAVKSNIKWIEYTSIGAAVIATKGTIYDDCCKDGCGLLANDEEWYNNIKLLLDNNDLRLSLVISAQEKLEAEYTENILYSQIQKVFKTAAERAKRECIN